MLNFIVRPIKRFAVLIPGLVIAYFAIRNIYPYIDRQVPFGLAIIVTYVLAAYILIPALIRLVRIIIPARHLQAYSVTPDGFASDPVNIGIIAGRRQLIEVMTAAGWHVADHHSAKNVIHEIASALFNKTYRNAPMSSLYLFGRKQDIGFEIPIVGERGHRHHVRFWATSYRPKASKPDFGTVEWHQRRTRYIGKNTLWVGAASKDIGFALIRHNVQITHMIDPDTDSERQLIINGLTEAGAVKNVRKIRINRPYRLMNRAWRGHLRSDGKLHIVRLKSTKR